jgi:hypothetical protein
LTVIPLFGAAFLVPLPGLMDKCAAVAAGAAGLCLPAAFVGLPPLEQAAAVSRTSVAAAAGMASCVRFPVNRPYRPRARP